MGLYGPKVCGSEPWFPSAVCIRDRVFKEISKANWRWEGEALTQQRWYLPGRGDRALTLTCEKGGSTCQSPAMVAWSWTLCCSVFCKDYQSLAWKEDWFILSATTRSSSLWSLGHYFVPVALQYTRLEAHSTWRCSLLTSRNQRDKRRPWEALLQWFNFLSPLPSMSQAGNQPLTRKPSGEYFGPKLWQLSKHQIWEKLGFCYLSHPLGQSSLRPWMCPKGAGWLGEGRTCLWGWVLVTGLPLWRAPLHLLHLGFHFWGSRGENSRTVMRWSVCLILEFQ